jgi:hypothetical protein
MKNLTQETTTGNINKTKEDERKVNFLAGLSMLSGYVLYDTTGKLTTDPKSFLIGTPSLDIDKEKKKITITLPASNIDTTGDIKESFSWNSNDYIYVILNNFDGDKVIRQPVEKDKSNIEQKIKTMKEFRGGKLSQYLAFCLKSKLDEQTSKYLVNNDPIIKGEIFFYNQQDIRWFSWSRRKARIETQIESLRRYRAVYIKERLELKVKEQRAAFADT